MKKLLLAALVCALTMALASPANAQAYGSEYCEASFYSWELAGSPTATGEPFDPLAYTVAHKTLPLNSYVVVTNAYTGQSVAARVSDRGPFIAGRCVDLSLASAQAIGLDYVGIGPVYVQPIGYNY